MNMQEKKKFIINLVYFSLWIIIVYFVIKIAAVYLLPFLIGVIISFFVQKPALFLSQKIKIKKQICSAVLSVFFYIIVFTLLLCLIWMIYSFVNSAIKDFTIDKNINNLLDEFILFFHKKFANEDSVVKNLFNESTSIILEKVSLYLSNSATSLVKKFPSLLISALITIVATCYISKDYDKLKLFLKGIIRKKSYARIVDIKNIFFDCFFKYSKGYFLIYSITFLELLLGLGLIGISKYFTLAILITLIDILPIFGTGIVLLPWAVFEFVQYNYSTGIGLVVEYLIIVLVRNFLEPKIIGKQIDINPLFTLVFVFMGLKIGGILGMIVFPITMTVIFTYLRKQIQLTENI